MKQFLSILLGMILFISCKKADHTSAKEEAVEKQAIDVSAARSVSNIGSVTICSQVWMQKNLEVTTYRNGDPIPQVTDPNVWMTLTTGAWCYYNNDPATGAIYGKLYNGFAVHDPRGLAPAGWRIPTNDDWTVLTNCLGGEILAGGKLKEKGTKHWAQPNTAATNSSRFTALPAGSMVAIDSRFMNLGLTANFWSSTLYPFSTTNSYYRRLVYNGGNVQSFGGALHIDGFSVRCIKE
ncbi:MAG TPA: fibrobacter succinogenes major paralogous domain-containing protein [Lacibacter sp.]|nr:fibrobacter succinogenes major paralogous domain-containing protein [Lacibacter sp.]